mgnify:CR=1 FL=1
MDLRNTQIYLITSRVRLTIDSPRYSIMQVALGQICRMGANKPLAVSISWEISCTIILVSVSPNWRLANSYGILPAAVQPGNHLLLNNLNIVDPKILWYHLSTLYFLDSWGSQHSKERIITGAGLRKSLCNFPIEAPLKSAILLRCMSSGVLIHFHPVSIWGTMILLFEIIQAHWSFILSSNNHSLVRLLVLGVPVQVYCTYE